MPHESAPRAFAHQRTNGGLAEHPEQGIAARTRHFVDNHHLGSKNCLEGRGDVFAFAHIPVTQQRSPQIINDVVRDVSASVVTLVDDGRVFADLREVAAIEVRVAARVGSFPLHSRLLSYLVVLIGLSYATQRAHLRTSRRYWSTYHEVSKRWATSEDLFSRMAL